MHMRLYTKTEWEQKLIVNFGSNSNSYSKMETFWMGKLSEKYDTVI